jgi:hypothetical protein
MTFTSPLFKQSLIQSDDGYTVQFLSREVLRYADGELVLFVGFDAGGGSISLMYKTVTQLAPHPGAKLSCSQEERVFGNLFDALAWKGFSVDFII